jgi:hypothetical protein
MFVCPCINKSKTVQYITENFPSLSRRSVQYLSKIVVAHLLMCQCVRSNTYITQTVYSMHTKQCLLGTELCVFPHPKKKIMWNNMMLYQ